MRRHEPKNMASSYQQAPENASSQEATPDLGIARMNLGAPSNTMMRSPTLPVQAGGPGDAQASMPGDAQAGESEEEQTKMSFIQRSEHDSRGSQGHDPSAQPRNHQKPSYESSSDDEEY